MVALLFAGAQLLSAQRTITGTVINADDNMGVPGATVTVRGTTTGTTTDINGRFSLNVPTGATHLVFAFMGLETQEVEIGGRTTINVTMASGIETLEGVVITGYGVARRGAFTGSAVAVSGEALTSRTTTNVLNALEGNVSGVQVTAASGQPGSSPEIRIRGFGSITGSNAPLIILDGATFAGNLNTINPDDIESITVLKDAASAALFGSRAANGVLVITTRTGRSQRAGLDIRFTQGFSTYAIAQYETVSPQQFYELTWQALRHSQNFLVNPDAANAFASNNLIPQLMMNITNVDDNQVVGHDGRFNPNAQLNPGITGDLDWFDPIMRLGRRSELSVSVGAANEATDIRASFNFVNEEGYIRGSDFNRFSGRVNMNHRVNDNIRTGLNLTASSGRSNFIDAGSATGFVNPFFFSRQMGPIYPVHAHDLSRPWGQETFRRDGGGNLLFDIGDGNTAIRNMLTGSIGRNGLGVARPTFVARHSPAETLMNSQLASRYALGGRTFVTLDFLQYFSFTANLAYDMYLYFEDRFANRFIGDGSPAGRSWRERNFTETLTANQLLNFNRTFNRVHMVSVLLGHEIYRYDYSYLYAFKDGQIVDGNPHLVNFINTNSLTSFVDAYRLHSYFISANYSFADRYVASASFRRDGSSKFHPDNRWGSFWSVGAAWRIDKENFMRNIPVISFLRLRTSYGETGSDGGTAVSLYAWQARYHVGPSFNNFNEPGAIIQSLGAPGVVWETNHNFDFGFEFGLRFGLRGTIEFFDRRSSNLLFNVPVPMSSGLRAPVELQNMGSMFNRGVELELSYDVRAGDFTWTPTLMLTHFRNEITKLPEGINPIVGTRRWEVGRSMFEFWLADMVKVDPTDGRALYRFDPETPTVLSAANHRIIEGDTFALNLSTAKRDYVGSAIPSLIGGFSNRFAWRGFDLNVLTTFHLGGKVYDAVYAGLMSVGADLGRNLHVDALQSWTVENTNALHPRLDQVNAINSDHTIQSTRWLVSGSFFALRAVNFGYTIPNSVTERVGIRNARVFFSGENLGMITARRGLNPAQNFTGVTTAEDGFLPTRFMTFGISASF